MCGIAASVCPSLQSKGRVSGERNQANDSPADVIYYGNAKMGARFRVVLYAAQEPPFSLERDPINDDVDECKKVL